MDWLLAIGSITFLLALVIGFVLTFITALYIPW